jgi:hypothetical protein
VSRSCILVGAPTMGHRAEDCATASDATPVSPDRLCNASCAQPSFGIVPPVSANVLFAIFQTPFTRVSDR